jgi:Na+-transporting methylmalonyl-CoA/oxaloacetate decarboxylase gamma subunit
VTDQLWEAATIAVVGVAVVMTALTILMLAIMLLTRLFPGKKGNVETEMLKATEGDGPTKDSIAAIAVAVALAVEEQKAGKISQPGESPVSRPVASRWSAAGRERLMGSRRKTEHKWGKPSR